MPGRGKRFRPHKALGKRTLKPPISLRELRRILSYDPDTGVMRWRVSVSPKMRKGKEAGSLDQHGYRVIGINGRVYRAHRLAWAHVYGEWPDTFIDHVDGNPSDNRISNLRKALPSENNRNSKRYANNSTGYKGVRPTPDGKFVAAICKNRRIVYLGRHDTPQDAHAAYVKAALEHHGEYANDGSQTAPRPRDSDGT